MGKVSGQSGSGRRYLGLDAEARARQRRAAVLTAALELFGAEGYAAISVKQICREAGLTERYFYESFCDREDSLTALYVDLVDGLRVRTAAAIDAAVGEGVVGAAREGVAGEVDIARRGLAAFIGFLTDDPRRARVVLIEVVGVSPALEDRRHGVLREFADLIAAVWLAGTGQHAPTEAQRLSAVGLVGAVNHLLVDWLIGGRRQRPAALVEVCATLFAAAKTAFW